MKKTPNSAPSPISPLGQQYLVLVDQLAHMALPENFPVTFDCDNEGNFNLTIIETASDATYSVYRTVSFNIQDGAFTRHFDGLWPDEKEGRTVASGRQLERQVPDAQALDKLLADMFTAGNLSDQGFNDITDEEVGGFMQEVRTLARLVS